MVELEMKLEESERRYRHLELSRAEAEARGNFLSHTCRTQVDEIHRLEETNRLMLISIKKRSDSLRDQLARKDEVIAAKDAEIAAKEAQLAVSLLKVFQIKNREITAPNGRHKRGRRRGWEVPRMLGAHGGSAGDRLRSYVLPRMKMQQDPIPHPVLAEVEEFFHGLDAQLKVPTSPTVSNTVMTTPTTVAEQRQVKRLNGEQRIKMRDSPIARPNRRKGEPKQANGRNIVAIRFCKQCRPRIQKKLTAAHRTIACCPECVLCTCG